MRTDERYVPACEEDAPEIARLEDDNERLRGEVAEWKAAFNAASTRAVLVQGERDRVISAITKLSVMRGWATVEEIERQSDSAEHEWNALVNNRDRLRSDLDTALEDNARLRSELRQCQVERRDFR